MLASRRLALSSGPRPRFSGLIRRSLGRKRSWRSFGALTGKEWTPPPPNTPAHTESPRKFDTEGLNKWMERWLCDINSKKAAISPSEVLSRFLQHPTAPNATSRQILLSGALYYSWPDKKSPSELEALHAYCCDDLTPVDKRQSLSHKVVTAWIRAGLLESGYEWWKKNCTMDDVMAASILLNACVRCRNHSLAVHIVECDLGSSAATDAHYEKAFKALTLSPDPSAGRVAEGLFLQQHRSKQMREGVESDVALGMLWRSLGSVIDVWDSRKHHAESTSNCFRIWKLMPVPTADTKDEYATVWLNTSLKVCKGLEDSSPADSKRVHTMILAHSPQHLLSTRILRKLVLSQWRVLRQQGGTISDAEGILEATFSSAADPSVAHEFWDTSVYDGFLQFCASVGDGERAEETLNAMIRERVELGKHSIRPTVVSFNSVFYAWSRCQSQSRDTVVARMEETFMLMTDLAESCGLNVKPAASTFNALLSVMNGNTNAETAVRGEHYFRLMQAELGATGKRLDPVLIAKAIALWANIDSLHAFNRAKELWTEFSDEYTGQRERSTINNAFLQVLARNSFVPDRKMWAERVKHSQSHRSVK